MSITITHPDTVDWGLFFTAISDYVIKPLSPKYIELIDAPKLSREGRILSAELDVRVNTKKALPLFNAEPQDFIVEYITGVIKGTGGVNSGAIEKKLGFYSSIEINGKKIYAEPMQREIPRAESGSVAVGLLDLKSNSIVTAEGRIELPFALASVLMDVGSKVEYESGLTASGKEKKVATWEAVVALLTKWIDGLVDLRAKLERGDVAAFDAFAQRSLPFTAEGDPLDA